MSVQVQQKSTHKKMTSPATRSRHYTQHRHTIAAALQGGLGAGIVATCSQEPKDNQADQNTRDDMGKAQRQLDGSVSVPLPDHCHHGWLHVGQTHAHSRERSTPKALASGQATAGHFPKGAATYR